MTQPFDPDHIVKILSSLGRRHWVAFAATCCERLLPHYVHFQEVEGWGDVHVLRQALDDVWAWAAGADIAAWRLEEMERECAGVMPDTADFLTILGSQALDASVAVCEALQLCMGSDLSRAVNVASSARDTVDLYVQERDDLDCSDPEFENRILSDPLMVRELTTQQEVLAELSARPTLESAYVLALRTRFQNRSNLIQGS